MSNPEQTEDCGCRDFSVTRRSLLRTAGVLGAGVAVTQMFGESMLQASFAGSPGGNTLVVVSLRGGIDGLGVVVPHGDPGYYKVRPSTAVPAASLICADSMFGLHPSMQPLAKYWQSGELAAVHATGLPVANRSHFSAIEEVEDADPGSSKRTGWINRMVGLGPTNNPLDGFQVGSDFPTTALTGDATTMAAKNLASLQVPGLDGYETQRYSSLGTIWSGASTPLATSADQAVRISKGPGSTLAQRASVAPAASYPTSWNATPFVAAFQAAAQLVKSDIGTDVIAIDAGSWDLHANYGNVSSGTMMYNIDGLAQTMAAFLDDLGTLRQRVTVVTISEFGRRVAENGSKGFDHGWGNMMLVAGAGVKGGKYYGNWPGLDAAALAEGDLKVTTDYRNVLGEIVDRRFHDRSIPQLFPGLSYAPLNFMQST
jgi:uncharacterized protein (DUF1501 family)